MHTNTTTAGNKFKRLEQLAQDPVFQWLLARPPLQSRPLLRLITNAVLSVVFDLTESAVIEGHRLVVACIVPSGRKLGRILCREAYCAALREFVDLRRQKATLALNRLDPTYDEFEANGVPHDVCEAGRKQAETPRLRLLKMRAEAAGEEMLDDNLEDRVMFHASAGDWYLLRSSGRRSGPYKTDPFKILLQQLGIHPAAVKTIINRASEVEAVARIFHSPRDRAEVCGVPTLNIYRPPRIHPLRGPWRDVFAVLHNLCDGDHQAVEFVLDWLARIVQGLWRDRRPFGRPVLNGSMLVFHGIEGSGKDTLRRIMSLLLGEENVALMGQEDLESKYHAQFDGALMLFCDEVVSSSNRSKQTENFIKKLINEKIPIEEKYESARLVINTMNVVFTSNDDVPVTISRTDRRFSVFHSSRKLSPDVARRIYDDLAGPKLQVAAFLDHLLCRKVKIQFGQLFETQAKEDIKRDSAPSDEKFAQAILEEGWWAVSAPWVEDKERDPVWSANDGNDYVIGDICREVYRDYCMRVGLRAVGDKKLTRTLKKMIPALAVKPMNIGQIKRRVYAGMPMHSPGAEVQAPRPRGVGADKEFDFEIVWD